MKKILLFLILAVVLAFVIGLAVVYKNIDGLAKEAILRYGPEITGTEVMVDSVSLDPMSGSATIQGLTVGNPSGYNAPHALRLTTLEIELEPDTLLEDTLVIRRLAIKEPVVTYEASVSGININRLRKDIQRRNSSGTTVKGEGGRKKKVIIDQLLITGGQVELIPLNMKNIEKSMAVSLPRIELKGIGREEGGATYEQAAAGVLQAVASNMSKVNDELFKGTLENIPKELPKYMGEKTKNAADAIKGIFGE